MRTMKLNRHMFLYEGALQNVAFRMFLITTIILLVARPWGFL